MISSGKLLRSPRPHEGERGLLGRFRCLEFVIKSEWATQLKPRLKFLTPSVSPFSHLNTNSFNSQRQYLLCTKEPGEQKDRLRGAKFLLDFLASPRASCKENISGIEWTSQQKQPADLAKSSFMSLGKCGPNKNGGSFASNYHMNIFNDSFFWHQKLNEVFAKS